MSEPAKLTPEVWRVWIREYGARGAIALALRNGYAGDEILEVNRAARAEDLAQADARA